MKTILALLVALDVTGQSFADDKPAGMTAVPAIPLDTPLIQGSCPNGVCQRATAFVRSAPPTLGQAQPQFAGQPCAAPARHYLFAPFGGRFRLIK